MKASIRYIEFYKKNRIFSATSYCKKHSPYEIVAKSLSHNHPHQYKDLNILVFDPTLWI